MESKLIGTIGRLDPLKGHDTLIRAMPYIVKQEPLARLSIVGHDPDGYGKELQVLINSLGLTGKVTLKGFVEDIPAFLYHLDVFALASTDEGFGQVLVEAMAAGLPIVVSRIPPFQEINPGLFASPNHPREFAYRILVLLKNPIFAQELGKRAQLRAKEMFSAEVMTRRTIEVYEKFQ